MAVRLPDGSLVALGTTLGSAITITGISNANPAVVSATAHGLSDGDLIVLTSGWSKLNNRVFRVASATTDSFALDGVDTTNTTNYPAGTGAGSCREVTAWTQISQILGIETSGGEMQFTTYSFLENDFESQLPTQFSAQTITLTIADDDSLPGYQALKAAGETRADTPLRLTLPSGAVILYNGVVSLNETPSLTKGQVMSVQATFSLSGRPVRYAA